MMDQIETRELEWGYKSHIIWNMKDLCSPGLLLTQFKKIVKYIYNHIDNKDEFIEELDLRLYENKCIACDIGKKTAVVNMAKKQKWLVDAFGKETYDQ